MSKRRERDSFMTPLVVEVMPLGKRFRLWFPFTNKCEDGNAITVPAGFETDLASIPVTFTLILAVVLVLAGHFFGIDWLVFVGVALILLAAAIPKLGRQNKAAVIHDYLYRWQGYWVKQKQAALGGSKWVHYCVDRLVADRIFLSLMVVLGVTPWKRRLMYLAVRLGGFVAWRNGPRGGSGD